MNNLLHPPVKQMKVALPGMDERAGKLLTMYLQGPCKQAGVVIVEDSQAEVHIIDIDLPGGKDILKKKHEEGSKFPLIVLSLREMDAPLSDTLFYIKKPITQDALLAALNKAKKQIAGRFDKTGNPAGKKSRLQERESLKTSDRETTDRPDDPPQALKHYAADSSEQDKQSKHKAAMQMDEKSFALYMGMTASLDTGNPAQLKQAVYNPSDYFQGYVQSACRIASEKGRVLELISGWKQLLIFPYSDEVWLDADDKQLRVFAGLPINHSGINKNMQIRPVDHKTSSNRDLDKFQSMDAFLWKLACWTSKGRFPQQIDIDQPVYLKHWPNFTRLLITPHALRMAALLVDKPKTPVQIAEILKIRLEYVFIFISAAAAVGLIGQTAKNAGMAPARPEPKPDKKHGFFSRIISKLRANKD
jgi:DNA-binding response OmpR family regulator